MYKHRRNANCHLSFFVRERFWPLFIPSIAIFFLTFCPQITQSIQINNNENPDRTVAKLAPRDIQITTTPPPSPLSIPVATSNSDLQETIGHTLYVVSLDGKITAIDARANGRQLWTADTGAPLVDSSLSKIEISRDSRSVRLIPSLIGGLYEKYDEDGHVEPLPFDADALLDASFKLHDEVVITGGKHIDTLGLDLDTGKILYSFSKDDPKQQNTLDNNRTTTTADAHDQRPTLIVKRTTQTVRARNVRNGHEKWNFSVSNHHLFHIRSQPASIVLGQVNVESEDQIPFSGYFEYQLQTGVVLAFDQFGHPMWSSAINAPIAAVWELKNGQLSEKSLFETTAPNPYRDENSDEEDYNSPPPLSRRLAFIGEFNSTPYVIVSPNVQKQLMYDARKNNAAGSIAGHRPLLSSWHKAYQKRTLSIGAELPENNNAQSSSSDSHYPLALRPDPTVNPHSHLASIDETCDTAGYLELTDHIKELFLDENSINRLNTHTYVYIPTNTIIILSIIIGVMIYVVYRCLKQKQLVYLSQKSLTTETSVCTTITPPSTPDYYQIEQPATPPFQSRYTVEYEHVRFLGRGGFGVVFEAINKLDERRVAIKRVSLKKASGKERALKEIRYLAVLNHPNLIQYYYAWNESPPTGWQEEEDRLLLVRDSANKRDSLSTFPTTGNDTGSINQCRSGSIGIASIPAVKPSAATSPLSFEITFDRSSHPLLINENFSGNSSNANDQSESGRSSSSSSSFDQQIDANNNTKSTTKSSVSSSSPLFDHSSDSSNEKPSEKKEHTETDDGIVFLPDEKQSTSSVPVATQTKPVPTEKEIPPTYFYFVMELCQPESLRDRLTKGMIDRQQAWSIFDQIIQGIEYIHSQKLIHRDLKPSNILFSMDNTVKIGDFGLVSAFGDEKLSKKIKRDDEKFDLIDSTSGGGNQEHGGTMLYMSPEQMNREPYNQKVDIYAIGIILFELLYPFSTQMERMQAIANVRQETPVFPKDFVSDGNNRSQMICRLISWLLSHSPRNRPRASDLRQDTFYQCLLKCEVPNFFSSISRQQSQTVVNGQDQVPACHHRTRVPSSSPFRRTVSSSAIQSHKESESGDGECVL